jgi:hypothetical protein
LFVKTVFHATQFIKRYLKLFKFKKQYFLQFFLLTLFIFFWGFPSTANPHLQLSIPKAEAEVKIMTDGQSASVSWFQASIWGP